LPYLKKLGTLEQICTFSLFIKDLTILNLEQNLEQVGTDLEHAPTTIILLRYKSMQQAREPFHVGVKRYLVKPLSVKQRSPHASPRVAAHARHARTNKELVSLAMHESQAQKNPGNLAATGARRLEVELVLFRSVDELELPSGRQFPLGEFRCPIECLAKGFELRAKFF
jgi:CheY-like chemotaxis protein